MMATTEWPRCEAVNWQGQTVSFHVVAPGVDHQLKVEPPRAGGAGGAGRPDQLCVLTWNVWENSTHLVDGPDGEPLAGRSTEPELRMARLAEVIAAHRPHVVLLQEVTAELMRCLCACPVVADEYWRSAIDHIPTAANCPSGLCILAREPFEPRLRMLPSANGRNFLHATLAGGLLVGTFHLESAEADHAVRAAQVAAIGEACRARAWSALVLGGDTNIKAGRTLDGALDFGLGETDVFAGDERPTRGPAAVLINLPPGWGPHSYRQDLLLTAGLGPCVHRRYVGSEVPYASDHLGVIAQFDWSGGTV